MITQIFSKLLLYLICTIIIEISIALFLKIKNKKDLLNIVLVNIMTNPVVNTVPMYFEYKFMDTLRIIIFVFLELLTVVVEGLIYKKYFNYNRINPFCVSIILNGSSYFIGLLILYVFKIV